MFLPNNPITRQPNSWKTSADVLSKKMVATLRNIDIKPPSNISRYFVRIIAHTKISIVHKLTRYYFVYNTLILFLISARSVDIDSFITFGKKYWLNGEYGLDWIFSPTIFRITICIKLKSLLICSSLTKPPWTSALLISLLVCCGICVSFFNWFFVYGSFSPTNKNILVRLKWW